MPGFAKLTMRDSGLPIHISPRHVEQVRLDPENYATAIYLSGKNSPIVVQEKMDVVMGLLQGLHEVGPVVVEADFRQAEPEPVEPPAAEPAPIALEPSGAMAKAPAPRKAPPRKRQPRPKLPKAVPPVETPGSWLLPHREA